MNNNNGTPKENTHPLFLLLREEDIDGFNARREVEQEATGLSGADFRGLDLRGANLNGLDLSNSYFRQADLRGLDLRSCNLEGASLGAAKISGTYFPAQLSPDEILMSLNYGTRLRYR